MTRPVKTFLGVTLFYFPMLLISDGWWALLLAPLFSLLALATLVFAPKVHKWVFGDEFYEIKLARQHKKKESTE